MGEVWQPIDLGEEANKATRLNIGYEITDVLNEWNFARPLRKAEAQEFSDAVAQGNIVVAVVFNYTGMDCRVSTVVKEDVRNEAEMKGYLIFIEFPADFTTRIGDPGRRHSVVENALHTALLKNHEIEANGFTRGRLPPTNSGDIVR